MDFSGMTQLISTVGFPIFCCICLGFFIYKYWSKMEERANSREDKLRDELIKVTEVNKNLTETNGQFVEVLKTYSTDLSTIKSDVSNIKDTIRQLT